MSSSQPQLRLETQADNRPCKRGKSTSADIEVLDEWQDHQRYASRHRVHVRKRDGATVVQEVYLFARLDAAGRFDCVEEVTLMLDGRPEDQDIGRVR